MSVHTGGADNGNAVDRLVLFRIARIAGILKGVGVLRHLVIVERIAVRFGVDRRILPREPDRKVFAAIDDLILDRKSVV